MNDDVTLLAMDLIEAVKAGDGDRAKAILMMELAGEVACEVAAIAGDARARAAEAEHRVRVSERRNVQFGTVAAVNQRLVRERDDLRERLSQYRVSGMPANERKSA